MYEGFIDISNFDIVFKQILANKKGKNVVYSRLVLDGLVFSDRVHFLVDYINSTKGIMGVTYKLLFWEDDLNILNAFQKHGIQTKDIQVHSTYLNNETPGEIFYSEALLNNILLHGLISMHFNFERAIEPAFNVRLQICLNRGNGVILFDIYDDRGCDVYFLCK
jgi:hypothetical protein